MKIPTSRLIAPLNTKRIISARRLREELRNLIRVTHVKYEKLGGVNGGGK